MKTFTAKVPYRHYTHTDPHTHQQTQTQTQIVRYIHAHTHRHICTHKIHTDTDINTTYMQTHTHTHTHTHMQTHTRTLIVMHNSPCNVAPFEVTLLTILLASQLYIPQSVTVTLIIIRVVILTPSMCPGSSII